MSDDNKNLSDDLDDMLDDAKENAKRTGEKISQSAKEFSDDARKNAEGFSNEAKSTAREFSDGAKETFGDNKKILAGILGILFGSLGIHKFVLGYNKEGGILLGVTLVGIVLSCVGIGIFVVWLTGLIGFIEGIVYLTKSDEEFYNTYQVNKKPWF